MCGPGARDELRQLEAILGAEVVAEPDPGQRRRNVERARAIVAGSHGGDSVRQPTAAEAQAWLDAELAKVPADRITDEFRREYGT